jgi:hypothetical protein
MGNESSTSYSYGTNISDYKKEKEEEEKKKKEEEMAAALFNKRKFHL